jgi:hypothetical protein
MDWILLNIRVGRRCTGFNTRTRARQACQPVAQYSEEAMK